MKSPNVLNFTIGTIAGLCAAIFPRLLAILAAPDISADLQLFSRNYIIASILFALLIGAVITIFEWGVREAPKDTFMAALGIPALLSGALNTASGVYALDNQRQEKERQVSELTNILGIEIMPPASVKTLPSVNPTRSGTLQIISSAHAANGDRNKKVQWNLGIKVREAPYVVVLDQAPTEAEAQQRAERLRARLPRVEVVRTVDNRFLVVQGGGPRSKSDALLEAIRIRREMGISTSLMEVE